MKKTFYTALNHSLEFLVRRQREGARLEEARRSFRQLQHQYPAFKMDLLWEEQAYDQSVYFDVLLQLPDAGTVSLSFCPEHALPWPMRGVHRWSEADLLRVNDTTLRVDQAMACLDCIWEQVPILNRLINVCLIQEELERNPIELSEDELQHAMDAFRRARGLCKADQAHRWMEMRGITQQKLEQLVADEAIIAKLRERITACQVERHYSQHRLDFEVVSVARIDFPDEASARESLARIQSGQMDFYAVAQECFVYRMSGALGQSGQLFFALRRSELEAQLAQALFSSNPGDTVGPAPVGSSYSLLRVLSKEPACLNAATRRLIEKLLFERWLEERRRAAKIEWLWGNTKQTAAT